MEELRHRVVVLPAPRTHEVLAALVGHEPVAVLVRRLHPVGDPLQQRVRLLRRAIVGEQHPVGPVRPRRGLPWEPPHEALASVEALRALQAP
jgi:hypothetical protein